MRPLFIPGISLSTSVDAPAVEIAQVAGENLSERGRCIDRQRRAAAVKPERREQREEPEAVVAVQDVYKRQFVVSFLFLILGVWFTCILF